MGSSLKGVEGYEPLEILYWLNLSRRDLILQSPANNGEVHGTFSLRTPVRPNPIGTFIVRLERVEGNVILVRGLDCLNGTPLFDIKPDIHGFVPLAPPQAGDSQVGDDIEQCAFKWIPVKREKHCEIKALRAFCDSV